MSKKSVRPAIQPQLSRRHEVADCINQALEKSDIAEICHAIAAATHALLPRPLCQKYDISNSLKAV
jgi:hypothetical protein